jgi:hypothetical protein
MAAEARGNKIASAEEGSRIEAAIKRMKELIEREAQEQLMI